MKGLRLIPKTILQKTSYHTNIVPSRKTRIHTYSNRSYNTYFIRNFYLRVILIYIHIYICTFANVSHCSLDLVLGVIFILFVPTRFSTNPHVPPPNHLLHHLHLTDRYILSIEPPAPPHPPTLRLLYDKRRSKVYYFQYKKVKKKKIKESVERNIFYTRSTTMMQRWYNPPLTTVIGTGIAVKTSRRSVYASS